MITLSFSPKAFADLERDDPQGAASTRDIIFSAVEVLARHPYIGRKVERGLRELVISRGRTGYLALYQFAPASSEVVIHTLRHQLEAGSDDL
jgi:plasmid stabilization system protein ParE